MNPPFNQSLVDAGQKVDRGWLSWFLFASGGGKVVTIVPPAAPTTYTYQNNTILRQQLIYAGGTVSAASFGRDGVNYFPLPTSGNVILNPGDQLKITYSVIPTTFVAVPI